MQFLKQLPNHVRAEQAVLGAVLRFPDIASEMIERDLNERVFYDARHKVLVHKMFQTYKKRGALDVHLLLSEISRNEQDLKSVGGTEYIEYLFNAYGSPEISKQYMDLIEEAYILRSVIEVSENIQLEARGFEGNLDEFLYKAEEQLQNVTRSNVENEMRTSADVVYDMIAEVEKAVESGGGITGLSTGFRDLDRVTSGLQNGDLIILGARPAMGKTAFALNLALEVARRNKNGLASVAFFSLEMPDKDLMKRLSSAVSQVPQWKLKSGKLEEEEFKKFYEASKYLEELNIYTDDSSGTTIPDIFKQCRALKNDDKLDFVVIDYLQLINSHDKQSSESRQQEISAISRALKRLAREMDVPVLALSQLSRSLENREDKRPRLADLRESGSIEQDADIVMFLHRDDYFDTQEEDDYVRNEDVLEQSQAQLLIRKHRNGSTGDINLTFVPEIGRFYTND